MTNFKFYASSSSTLTLKGFNTFEEAKAWADEMNESDDRFYKTDAGHWESVRPQNTELPAVVMTAAEYEELNA